MLPLLSPYKGRQQLNAAALGQLHYGIHHLIHGLSVDPLAAPGAVGYADPGIEQPQVVINLRNCTYGGTGIPAGGFLIDGDGRGQAFNIIHIGLFHQTKELAGISGQ